MLRTGLGLPNRKCLKNSVLKAFPVHFPKKFSPRLSLSACMTATPGCDLSPRTGSHKSPAARGGFLLLLSCLRPHKPMLSHLLYVEEGSLHSRDSWFILTSGKSQKLWPFTLGRAHSYSCQNFAHISSHPGPTQLSPESSLLCSICHHTLVLFHQSVIWDTVQL